MGVPGPRRDRSALDPPWCTTIELEILHLGKGGTPSLTYSFKTDIGGGRGKQPGGHNYARLSAPLDGVLELQVARDAGDEGGEATIGSYVWRQQCHPKSRWCSLYYGP